MTLYIKIYNNICHRYIYKINDELEKLYEWFELHKLALDVDK